MTLDMVCLCTERLNSSHWRDRAADRAWRNQNETPERHLFKVFSEGVLYGERTDFKLDRYVC